MSINEIINEANGLVERIKIKYPNFVGKTAKEKDIERLEEALTIKLPKWYIELYSTVPLIDAEFGIQEFEPEEDFDGVSYMIWGGLDDVIDESTVYEPGVSVLKDKYIFIAS